ncbi:hypothetical protein C8J56DRAFT_893077 [Mycena floridula]|nr:hypothetical protein C8J56DRAFT_893077 [Mycena floridula]
MICFSFLRVSCLTLLFIQFRLALTSISMMDATSLSLSKRSFSQMLSMTAGFNHDECSAVPLKRSRFDSQATETNPITWSPGIHFNTNLSTGEKAAVLRHMLATSLQNKSLFSYPALVALAAEHNMLRKQCELLLKDLETHSCTWACLVCSADARDAGIVTDAPQLSSEFARHPCPMSTRGARRRAQHARVDDVDKLDQEWWAQNWPQVESEATLKAIMHEHQLQTSSNALRREACSFCNHDEIHGMLKIWDKTELNILLLNKATVHLRNHFGISSIPSHQLFNGKFHACQTCRRCVKGNAFFKIPHLSWANGCWIGAIPTELGSLTYAEELAQRAAHGNICIHPQEITTLAKVLPCPVSMLYDEIVMIFVSNGGEATEDMFKRGMHHVSLLYSPRGKLRKGCSQGVTRLGGGWSRWSTPRLD